jgi:hypothetical protein
MRANHSFFTAILIASAFATLSSPTLAQRSNPGFIAQRPAPIGAPLSGHLVRANHAHRHRSSYAHGPNFYPDYYDDSGDQNERDRAGNSTRIIVQAPAPPPPAAAPAKIPEPLVMELRGDHWVRLASTASEPNGPYADPAAAHTPPAPLPAAILVFRDGHQEEVSRYTIIGRSISIKSDYWTTGSWTRKILISDLDIPATLKLNQARRANFALPSRPGEVMMRP